MRKSILIGMTAAAVLAGGALLVQAQGMMGGYGMGGSSADRPVDARWNGSILSYAQAATYIEEGDQAGSANKAANSVTYTGKDITINMVAVQPDHDDQTFEVHGLTNPTLVVPVGATVHLNLLNMDYGNNMEHAVLLTTAAPPYPYMSMMTAGASFAEVAPLLPWRSEKDVDTARYAMLGTTFFAQQAGTYWYICPTPAHAEKGMFGKFVIG